MNVWLSEEHTAGYAVHWRLRDIIHVEQTPYQELLSSTLMNGAGP